MGPDIADMLWQQACARVWTRHAANELALVIWDENVLENLESQSAPEECHTRSSTGRRMRRWLASRFPEQ